LLLPSIYECGGAVVLEAMAAGTPVIAVAWGGPEDYLDETCGILVSPLSAKSIIEGFVAGMTKLIAQPQLRCTLGTAGRLKIETTYSWEEKVDRVIGIYLRAIEG
jgi:glycosyltransferase involved in cell wall biosynthesis